MTVIKLWENIFKNRMYHQLNRVSQIWGWHYILFHFLGGNADMDNLSFPPFQRAVSTHGNKTGNPCGGTLKLKLSRLSTTINPVLTGRRWWVDKFFLVQNDQIPKCVGPEVLIFWVHLCSKFCGVIFKYLCMKNIETRYQLYILCAYTISIITVVLY